MTEKLTGIATGTSRESLITFATEAAANYYDRHRSHIHVELSNATVEYINDGGLCSPNIRTVTGYEANFTAEVIEP